MTDPNPSGSGSGGTGGGTGPAPDYLFGKEPAGGPDAPDFEPLNRPRRGRWLAIIGGLAVLAIVAYVAVPVFKGAFAPKKTRRPAIVAVPAAPSAAAKSETPAVPAPTEPAQAEAPAPSAPTVGPPTGASITIGCSIPEVGTEVVASCDWAQEGGVVFENLRWEGEVLMGTIVVTLVDGRVYAGNDMAVAIQPKTPTMLAAR